MNIFIESFIRQRRMQMPKCIFLTCEGQEISKDQLIQERISSSYALEMRRSHHQCANKEQNVHNPKSVFSFKLNCTRVYDQSDKNKESLAYREIIPIKGTQYCANVQRLSLKPIQQKKTIQCSKRYFASPQPYKLTPNIVCFPGNIQINPLILYRNQMQPSIKTCINFIRARNMDMNQIKESNEKNLTETSYSSISSLHKLTTNKKKQQKNPESSKIPQVIQYQKQVQEQKSFLKNSCFSLRSNNSIQAQEVYPSFDKVQNIQPRNFFRNASTMKSIFTSSQLKDHSLIDSFKNFNANMASQQDLQISVEVIDPLNTRRMNHFSKNKRKTAYFGCVEDSSENQKIAINDFKKAPQDNLHQIQKFQSNQKKKIIHQNQVKTEQKLQMKKSNLNQQKSNRRVVYQPSLHNIIQSTQVEPKISIQSSIKQMHLISHDVTKDNGPRFKHVNTTKSIGGQSFISENSYIDIKFMQNLNSKRAVVKLV